MYEVKDQVDDAVRNDAILREIERKKRAGQLTSVERVIESGDTYDIEDGDGDSATVTIAIANGAFDEPGTIAGTSAIINNADTIDLVHAGKTAELTAGVSSGALTLTAEATDAIVQDGDQITVTDGDGKAAICDISVALGMQTVTPPATVAFVAHGATFALTPNDTGPGTLTATVSNGALSFAWAKT